MGTTINKRDVIISDNAQEGWALAREADVRRQEEAASSADRALRNAIRQDRYVDADSLWKRLIPREISIGVGCSNANVPADPGDSATNADAPLFNPTFGTADVQSPADTVSSEFDDEGAKDVKDAGVSTVDAALDAEKQGSDGDVGPVQDQEVDICDPLKDATVTLCIDNDGDKYLPQFPLNDDCEILCTNQAEEFKELQEAGYLVAKKEGPFDCDDANPELHPKTVWYYDGDGDGFGTDNKSTNKQQCDLPDSFSAKVGDCDDGADGAEVYPGHAEVCNNVDDDCDDEIDEDFVGKIEICDGIDNDCDGQTDVWTVKHNGSANGDDEGRDVAVDSSGNVYAVGFEAVPGQGQNVWLGKYDPDGKQLWSTTYDGSNSGIDWGTGVVLDLSGNVYVTGVVDVLNEGLNILLNKYDSDGKLLWTRTNNGLASKSDGGHDVVLDPSGNIYVTGYTAGPDQIPDIVLYKYDPAGNPLWVATYNSGPGHNDQAFGVAVDLQGNPYVTGFVTHASEGRNAWINKYDKDGKQVWSGPEMYDGGVLGNDEGRGIAVDLLGDVYITGLTTMIGQGSDIWINKYDKDGNQKWTNPKTYGGLDKNTDIGLGITLESLELGGNVYVAGYVTDPEQGENVWIHKYASLNGANLWSPYPIVYNGLINGNDQAHGVAVGSEGNVHVTGFETVEGQAHDVLIQKYICTP